MIFCCCGIGVLLFVFGVFFLSFAYVLFAQSMESLAQVNNESHGSPGGRVGSS